MSSRKRNSLIMLIIASVLGVAVVVSAVLLILQRVGGLESITISPTFADTELDVNMDYAISVNTDPSGAKVAKFDFVSDSSSATFEYKDDGVAVIHTSGEGAVTVYVEGKGIESNKLTFNIVDKAAQAAAEAAAAQAAAEAEALAAQQAAEEAAAAEAAAAQVVYVKVIKDSVNVRSAANTDCDIVGKAKQGDTFEVINDDGSWTELKFGEQTGFIRNDMIQVVSEGEDASATTPAPTEEKKEETKKEEQPKTEEKTAEQKAAEEAAAAQKAAEEAAQKAAEEAAAQAAALAAAQPVGYTINCADGPASFTQQQYNFIKGFWSYTGDWEASAHKHTKSELISVCQIEGGIY